MGIVRDLYYAKKMSAGLKLPAQSSATLLKRQHLSNHIGKPITIDPTRIKAYIPSSGYWATSSDSYSVLISVTEGKTYAVKMTNTDSAVVGTVLRFGFSERDTPGNLNDDKVLLTQLVRSTPQDAPYTELVADNPYMVIQMSSDKAEGNVTNGYIVVKEL